MIRRWLVFLFVLAGCVVPAVLTPATGPGTSYPCGVAGQVCTGGGCCNADAEVCGGDTPGCPAGMCCALGNPDVLAAKKRKQDKSL